MAHWAEIGENNTVVRVLVGDNNDPNGDEGYQWLIDNLGGRWIKTSYNARNGKRVNPVTNEMTDEPALRAHFAGIGFMYLENLDIFMPPKEYPSWILDTTDYTWVAPVPRPDSGFWYWDEDTLSWKERDKQ
jgi:hypothetical protein